MGEVDPAFIQDPEHRPRLSQVEAEGIPLIDLSPIYSDDDTFSVASHEALVRDIANACKQWGFFQVINHGVPLEKLQKIEAASRDFFAQSLEEKRKIKRDEREVYGYYDAENTKNVRDWKEVFDFTILDPTIVPASQEPDDKEVMEWHNQWPLYPPHLRETCQEYGGEMVKLGYKLLELLALGLGLPADKFHGFFKDQTSFIRFNHYPPCPTQTWHSVLVDTRIVLA